MTGSSSRRLEGRPSRTYGSPGPLRRTGARLAIHLPFGGDERYRSGHLQGSSGSLVRPLEVRINQPPRQLMLLWLQTHTQRRRRAILGYVMDGQHSCASSSRERQARGQLALCAAPWRTFGALRKLIIRGLHQGLRPGRGELQPHGLPASSPSDVELRPSTSTRRLGRSDADRELRRE